MAIPLKKRTFENPDDGTHDAVLVNVVDIGTEPYQDKETKETNYNRKLYLGFELAQKMKDGRPFMVSCRVNMTCGENGNLYKRLNGMGTSYDCSRLGDGVMPEMFLGSKCRVFVTFSKGGWPNVTSTLPPTSTHSIEAPVNPLINWDFDCSVEELETLSAFVQSLVKKSPEYQEKFGAASDPFLKDV